MKKHKPAVKRDEPVRAPKPVEIKIEVVEKKPEPVRHERYYHPERPV